LAYVLPRNGPVDAVRFKSSLEMIATTYNEEYFDRYRRLKPDTLPCFSLIMKYLDLNSNDTLLDIGCGVGDWAGEFSKLDASTVGMDAYREPLMRARGAHPDVDFVRADASALPFRDGAFSKVSCLSVIEHVDMPDLLLQEIARVMRQNSTTVLITPDSRSAIHRFAVVHDPTHKRLYNTQEFAALMSRVFGLETLEKTSLTNKLGPLSRLIKSEIIVRARRKP